ncbi:MAG: hypothetical protein ABSD58_16650 [Verrucomicrobiia bacterium]|jgi:hypothetical protein
MLRLKPSLIDDLLNQAESGMGYQIVQATMDDDRTKCGIAFNSEVLLFDDESFGDFARHFQLFEYKTALGELRPSGQRVKALRVIPQASARQQTASVKESAPTYAKRTGGAADAPCEETKAGDVFRRFSAFANDRRIRPDGGVYPGTYATTKEDGDKVKTGQEAVARYALPNPMPASYKFTIEPHEDTVIQKGIAQPAYGQPGGGVEVIFTKGTDPKTVTGREKIPDK